MQESETAHLLKRVARSFYLTIRLLPGKIRDSVALAYLLARASDSVADQASMGSCEKRMILETLGKTPFCNAVWCNEIAGRLSKKGEQDLWRALPMLMMELQKSSDADLIRVVWAHILKGQRSDVEWFEVECKGRLSVHDLDNYLYWVAGSVGEFWTAIIERHMSNKMVLPAGVMSKLGVEYGKALQLVNILRDSRDDNRIGRRYFCAEDEDFWRQRAWEYCASAHRYCTGLKRGRLRFATATPLMLCEATLNLMSVMGCGARLKRNAVYGILFKAAIKHL